MTEHEQSFETLLEDLQHADAVIRAQAVHAISLLQDPRALKPLIWLLADESLWVRCSAAEALGELRHPDALEPLLQFLRLGASRELAQVGAPSEIPVRFHSFTRTPDPIYSDWLSAQGVSVGETGFSLVISARLALQHMGLLATDALLPLLTDENPYMQYVAVLLLNSMSLRAKPQEALVAALQSDQPLLRINATRALAKLGNLSATAPISALLADAVPAVRITAAEALGTLKDRRATEALHACLTDPDPLIQAAIQTALNALEDIPHDDDPAE